MEPAEDLWEAIDAQFRSKLTAYVNSLLRRFLNRSENPGYAEDVVSETLAAAYEHYGHFDPSRGALESWLFRIARNKSYDFLRRNAELQSEVSFDDERLDVERDAQASVLLYAKDAKATPKTLALRRALRKLTRYDQDLLICRFGHGLGYEDMERYFNFTVRKATLRVHVNRAQARLRKELAALPEFRELFEQVAR